MGNRQTGKGRRLLFRKTFIKTALIVLLLVFAATAFTMTIGLRISTNYILNASRIMREDLLNVYQQNMQHKLSSLFQSVNLLMLDTEVEEFIYAPTAEPNYLLIRSMLQKLTSHLDIDPIVDSLYIFDRQRDYVLADGYYRKAAFYDPVVFSDAFLDGAPISGTRDVEGKRIFSFIFQPLTTPIQNPTTIVVNISVDRIAAMMPTPVGLGDFVLVNDRHQILYTSADIGALSSMIDALLGLEGRTGVVSSDDKLEYLVTATVPNSFGTRLVLFQRYDLATYDRVILRALIMPSLAGVLIGFAALAIIAAIYLYHPLNKTVNRLVEQGYSPKKINEYDMIDHAVHQLVASQQETEARYNEASRIRDLYYLQEFLIAPIIDREKFDSLLNRLQLVFDLPCFLMIVADLHDRGETVGRPIPLPDASLFPATFKVIANQVAQDRIASILNFSSAEASIPVLASQLKQWLNDQNWDVCLYCSDTFYSLDELPSQYNLCDRMLAQRFFIGYDALLTRDSTSIQNRDGSARHGHELLAAVKAANELLALQILGSIIAENGNVSSPDAMELVKFRLMELCVDIMSEARGPSASMLDIAAQPSYEHFLAIRRSKTLDEIRVALEKTIHSVIEQLAHLAHHRNEQLIQRAKEYIQSNLSTSMSLDDIAQSVYLSTNYFCSIFKAKTGATVMDYVMEQRIELACRILKEQPELKINVLAMQLGYNSVQSFIRQFKKVTQTTPDKYRRDSI